MSWLLLILSLHATDLQEFSGVYRGVTPGDGSRPAFNEIEVSVTASEVRLRTVARAGEVVDAFPTDFFVPMTAEEMKADGISHPERKIAFRSPTGRPQFIFLKKPRTNTLWPTASEFGLVVRLGGEFGKRGETRLLSPKQLGKVSCGRLLRMMELTSPLSGKIVRLEKR